MEPLPRSWLIMVSLCTILHGHGILAKIMARSWQDLGKATKELAMDLGKDAMASNTGLLLVHVICDKNRATNKSLSQMKSANYLEWFPGMNSEVD